MNSLRRFFGIGSRSRARSYESKEAVAIKLLAAKGDIRAKSLLGRMYFKGECGVPQDYAEAALWLFAASEAGDADAQGLLGMALEQGLGVSCDYAKAAELYAKAAAQGVDAAAYFLGKLFLEGKGVPKDSTEAAKWFLKSAHAGNSGAQGILIALYLYGEGLPENSEEAYFWALVADRAKYPPALQLATEIAATLSSEKREEIKERARFWNP